MAVFSYFSFLCFEKRCVYIYFYMETREDMPQEGGDRLAPITTMSGDKGTSSLYNGKRLPKYDIHFEALGTLDECNSFIGLSREYLHENCQDVDQYLETIQCVIFDVNAAVATPLKTSSKRVLSKTTFDSKHVKDIEEWSYLLNKELPVQDSFLLPVLLANLYFHSLEERQHVIYIVLEVFVDVLNVL